MLYNSLKAKYRGDYESILKELRPGKYENKKEEERRANELSEKQTSELKERLRKKEERLYKEWKDLGGE